MQIASEQHGCYELPPLQEPVLTGSCYTLRMDVQYQLHRMLAKMMQSYPRIIVRVFTVRYPEDNMRAYFPETMGRFIRTLENDLTEAGLPPLTAFKMRPPVPHEPNTTEYCCLTMVNGCWPSKGRGHGDIAKGAWAAVLGISIEEASGLLRRFDRNHMSIPCDPTFEVDMDRVANIHRASQCFWEFSLMPIRYNDSLAASVVPYFLFSHDC